MYDRVLYVTGATGPRHEAHMSYTLPLMRRHLGKDNVLVTPGKRPGDVEGFVWTTLAVDDAIRERYDRLVWIDADVEVLSPEFAEFAHYDCGGAEAWACLDPVPETGVIVRRLAKEMFGLEVPCGRPYVNTGVLGLNLSAIDKNSWATRVYCFKEAAEFPSWDQALLHCMTDAVVAPPKFNVYWSWRDLVPDACAIHYNYAGPEAKIPLDEKCGWKG